MPPKRGNRKPKGAAQPKRKNSSNSPKEKVYNQMRDAQAQRWRAEAPRGRQRSVKQAFQSEGQMGRSMGNAALIRQPRIGMPDLMSHCVSWIAGDVYVGNGTLGATNSVYFRDATATYVNPAPVPVLGQDALVGATYVVALEKLYRRKRFRRVTARFLAVQSSTTNNMTLTVAPVRGPPGTGETGLASTTTTAAITQTNAMSMTGSKTVDSFEDAIVDLTPYIAGGSGAQQNEFAISESGATPTNSPLLSQQNLLGACPASFVVAGNSTVAALQGSATHKVLIETIVDYLDFVGGVPVIDPSLVRTVTLETRDEKRARLLSELSAVAREDSAERDRVRSPSKGKGELL